LTKIERLRESSATVSPSLSSISNVLTASDGSNYIISNVDSGLWLSYIIKLNSDETIAWKKYTTTQYTPPEGAILDNAENMMYIMESWNTWPHTELLFLDLSTQVFVRTIRR